VERISDPDRLRALVEGVRERVAKFAGVLQDAAELHGRLRAALPAAELLTARLADLEAEAKERARELDKRLADMASLRIELGNEVSAGLSAARAELGSLRVRTEDQSTAARKEMERRHDALADIMRGRLADQEEILTGLRGKLDALRETLEHAKQQQEALTGELASTRAELSSTISALDRRLTHRIVTIAILLAAGLAIVATLAAVATQRGR
jgi:chromosome segregation ATPase